MQLFTNFLDIHFINAIVDYSSCVLFLNMVLKYIIVSCVFCYWFVTAFQVLAINLFPCKKCVFICFAALFWMVSMILLHCCFVVSIFCCSICVSITMIGCVHRVDDWVSHKYHTKGNIGVKVNVLYELNLFVS